MAITVGTDFWERKQFPNTSIDGILALFPLTSTSVFFLFLSSTLATVSVPYQKCLVGLKSEFTEKRPPNSSSKLRLNLWGIKKTNQVVQNLKAKKQTKLVFSSFKIIK